MPEDMNDARAQKLAAARRKLKDYQKQRNEARSEGSISSNLSERSDSELNLNGHVSATDSRTTTPPPIPSNPNLSNENTERDSSINSQTRVQTTNDTGVEASSLVASAPVNTAASYFASASSTVDNIFNVSNASTPTPTHSHQLTPTPPSVLPACRLPLEPLASAHQNAIQVLISEKAEINAELNKYRTRCKEHNKELEESGIRFNNLSKQLNDAQERLQTQQHCGEQLRNTNAELQHKLAQVNAENEDHLAHVEELKNQLDLEKTKSSELEQQLNEKSRQFEMAQIRIQQLSDVAGAPNKDDRVEALTQTQFMYEQQIRDLQAMVQQLTQDKEQANSQYQNYVQHLNTEVSGLNEKNAELLDECAKLQERERQLVDHVSSLEREIQKNIARQDQFKSERLTQQSNTIESSTANAVGSPSDATLELEKLREKVSEFDMERHEFQLKIKSQEDRLEAYETELQKRQTALEEYQEHVAQVAAEQPDKTRLLATMESDKIAASRALSQNVELKKQLDELEMRFVQLTNDKADLTNRLDAEEYANREMRTNYSEMEERLKSIDERFKFKDEEMIRLSHENMELKQRKEDLEEKLKYFEQFEAAHEHSEETQQEKENDSTCLDHDHHHHHHHDEILKGTDSIGHEYDPCHEAKESRETIGNQTVTDIGTKTDLKESVSSSNHDDISQHNEQYKQEHNHHHHHSHHRSYPTPPPFIATSEAVEKLEARFTQLISQVADLTDEKQRLEHLVLQLQGETETIGEYITLYQTQRRMLKQREYEKAAQMQLLQVERQQLRDKIQILNNLVTSLGVEIPQNIQLQKHLHAALNESGVSIEGNNSTVAVGVTALPAMIPVEESEKNNGHHVDGGQTTLGAKLYTPESQDILNKIQTIITEINEDTTKEVPTVPTQTGEHLNCCLGKFEIV